MPNNPNAIANLKPAKPGDVRNPKGGPKGRRFSTLLNKVLKGKMTVKEAGEEKTLSKAEIVVLKLVTNAIDDRNSAADQIRAAVAIMDRIDGKPDQALTGPDGTPLSPPNLVVNMPDGLAEEPK